MATTTCPSCGAASGTADYCDSCGAPLAAAPASASTPGDTPGADASPLEMEPCPNCGAARSADDAFCEGCGLDFATGQMPAAPAPAASTAVDGGTAEWTAVITPDRAFFDGNEADSATALAFPDGLDERRVALTGDEVVIGRKSDAKGFFPAIDLSSPVPDAAVSHRHAILRRQPDGTWAIVDEMSTNGTWINGAGQPLEHGVLTALHDGDRINLGSFTRITIVHEPGAQASP